MKFRSKDIQHILETSEAGREVNKRAEENRKQAEADRREALGSEGREKEDKALADLAASRSKKRSPGHVERPVDQPPGRRRRSTTKQVAVATGIAPVLPRPGEPRRTIRQIARGGAPRRRGKKGQLMIPKKYGREGDVARYLLSPPKRTANENYKQTIKDFTKYLLETYALQKGDAKEKATETLTREHRRTLLLKATKAFAKAKKAGDNEGMAAARKRWREHEGTDL
jgi:hypothetical protein